jgi:hypothetical protein
VAGLPCPDGIPEQVVEGIVWKDIVVWCQMIQIHLESPAIGGGCPPVIIAQVIMRMPHFLTFQPSAEQSGTVMFFFGHIHVV